MTYFPALGKQLDAVGSCVPFSTRYSRHTDAEYSLQSNEDVETFGNRAMDRRSGDMNDHGRILRERRVARLLYNLRLGYLRPEERRHATVMLTAVCKIGNGMRGGRAWFHGRNRCLCRGCAQVVQRGLCHISPLLCRGTSYLRGLNTPTPPPLSVGAWLSQ